MSEEQQPGSSSSGNPSIDPLNAPLKAPLPDPLKSPERRANASAMFAAKPQEEGGTPVAAWVIAGLVVLVVLGGLMFVGRRKAAVSDNSIQPLAAYAANLPLSQLAMSESTSLSGGKSTFVDGHVKNTGDQTLTGVTVQVIFRNDEGLAPQVETLPLRFIRMREPYIDTESVSAAPLKPGDEQDFRLIFETIPANWNMQMPEVHVVRVEAK